MLCAVLVYPHGVGRIAESSRHSGETAWDSRVIAAGLPWRSRCGNSMRSHSPQPKTGESGTEKHGGKHGESLRGSENGLEPISLSMSFQAESPKALCSM